MSPYELEQIEILRRIAERGKRFAETKGNEEFVDLFVHLLDEIKRLQPTDSDGPCPEEYEFTSRRQQ